MQNWEMLTGGCVPCPLVFDPNDVHKTRELDKEQREADKTLETCWALIGYRPEGWVPVEYYEEAMAHTNQLKEYELEEAELEECHDHVTSLDLDMYDICFSFHSTCAYATLPLISDDPRTMTHLLVSDSFLG
jgi:hypothetical protein